MYVFIFFHQEDNAMTENRDVGIESSGLSTAREGLTKRPSIIAMAHNKQQQHLCISIILFYRRENNGLHVIENPAAAGRPLNVCFCPISSAIVGNSRNRVQKLQTTMYSLNSLLCTCTAGVSMGNRRLLLRYQISAKV